MNGVAGEGEKGAKLFCIAFFCPSWSARRNLILIINQQRRLALLEEIMSRKGSPLIYLDRPKRMKSIRVKYFPRDGDFNAG